MEWNWERSIKYRKEMYSKGVQSIEWKCTVSEHGMEMGEEFKAQNGSGSGVHLPYSTWYTIETKGSTESIKWKWKRTKKCFMKMCKELKNKDRLTYRMEEEERDRVYFTCRMEVEEQDMEHKWKIGTEHGEQSGSAKKYRAP